MVSFDNSLILFAGHRLNKVFMRTIINFYDDIIFKGKEKYFIDGTLLFEKDDKIFNKVFDKHKENIQKQVPEFSGKAGPSLRIQLPEGKDKFSASTFLDVIVFSYIKKIHSKMSEEGNNIKYLFVFNETCGDLNLFSKLQNTIKHINRFENQHGYIPNIITSPIDYQYSHLGFSTDFLIKLEEFKENDTEYSWGKTIPINPDKDYFDTVDTLKEVSEKLAGKDKHGVVSSTFFSLKYYDESVKKAFEES